MKSYDAIQQDEANRKAFKDEIRRIQEQADVRNRVFRSVSGIETAQVNPELL